VKIDGKVKTGNSIGHGGKMKDETDRVKGQRKVETKR
jgi:hypothetical protein